MFNFSKRLRNSEHLDTKLEGYISPEIFLAENVKDYDKNSYKLSPPHFKKIPLTQMGNFVIVIIHNVRLNQIYQNDKIVKNFYIVGDSSKNIILPWNTKGMDFPGNNSYSDLISTGFQNGDHVKRVFIRHLFKENLGLIAQVDRFDYGCIEKETLLDKIRKVLPELNPNPLTQYLTAKVETHKNLTFYKGPQFPSNI